jgi:hypothetical protein
VRIGFFFKALAMTLALAGSVAMASRAMADRIILKDGTVLEGKITREGERFYFITVKIGGIEQNKFVNRDDVKSIERDSAPAPDPAAAVKAPDAAPEAAAKEGEHHSGATRLALLHFGPPNSWHGTVENMVGRDIGVRAFREVVPLLEKDKVDIVVIAVNSGGGMSLEMPKFQDLFEKVYKPKFRTVAWIESAISAAAMAPWPIEEYYFTPSGNMGACTEFNMSNLVATKGAPLEEILFRMEKVSGWGKKDPAIMRAMQIMSPLSVDIDSNGEVHWRADEDGQVVLNHKDKIFTITASDAVKYKFARGIAATQEELVKAMGLQEAEWVAQDATDFVDKSLRDNDAAFKAFNKLFEEYEFHIGLAQQLPDKQQRSIELARAKKLLAELKSKLSLNAVFPLFVGATPEWFKEQEDLIKKLAELP